MKQYTQYIYKDNEWRELGGSGGDGTVSQVNAGAGLNTTSDDTGTDGGSITSSGTLYLTKSGVTAGTYQGITVDKYGRVTSASDQGYTTNTGTITKVQANGTDVATSGTANIPAASTSAYGVTELSSATNSTSEALAATPKAVKAAYDLAASKGTGTITGVSVNGTSVATSGVANITSMPASILSGAIPSAVTATTQSASDNSTKLATTAFVKTAIDNLPEPMIFKGSLGTGGTVTALPVDGSATIGDTYKVITAGTYASKAAKVGDTFICLTKTSSANTWELIPSGDEPSGTVTSITIKGSSPITVDSESAITTSGTRTISHANSGVTAGTYKSVTVNATGHVTAGTNPTTLSGYGITDAKISNGTITLGSNSITPLTSEVNTNLRNGSASHSLRTTGSAAESDSYTLGQYAFAEGSGTQASGKYSHAEGDRTIASGQRAHVEGLQTQATANAAHAEGSGTIASQGYAHAEGSNTRALGFGDHAEGSSTMASGGYSHAEGYFTTARGGYSHAEGQHNTDANVTGTITAIDSTNLKVSVSGIPRLTSGDYKYQLCGTASDWDVDCYITNASYASNIYTFTVSKWNSSFAAEGTFKIFLRPVAYGNGSHAEGQATYAFSDVTHAEGLGTVANSKAQHVQGKWNVVNAAYADIVGNGTDNANRSNAYTLDWDGNGIYAGKLTVGSGPANNMDVATKQYVDALVSSSSNTNGKYIRIGDIQICTQTINIAKTDSSNFGSGTDYYGSTTWTYPQAFTEVWSIQVTAINNTNGTFSASTGSAPTTTSCAVMWMGSNATTLSVSCFVIGKWK